MLRSVLKIVIALLDFHVWTQKSIKRESTRKAPCVKYEPKTCQSIEDNKLILERFHCRIPFLNSGQHLNDLIPKGTPDCGYQVTLEALDFISKKESNCVISRTCENTRFTSNYKVVETWFEDKTMIYVTLKILKWNTINLLSATIS